MSGTLSNLWRRLGNRSKAAKAENPPPSPQDGEIQGEKPMRAAIKLVFFDTSEEYDIKYLLKGRAEVLGYGTISTSYKAVLEDGRMVMVKRLRDVVLNIDKFTKTMNSLGAMRHENLLPLKAYYYYRRDSLLLTDYMPQRSLYELLHGGTGSEKTVLSWQIRQGIALGAARAIEYLHSQGPKIFHGNFKSTNVLLTASYDPLVSDYGLTHIQAPPKGASKATNPQKDDVYSFGVLLLELLTGKMPDGSDLAPRADLVSWVKYTIREDWTSEVFDPELGDYQNFENEILGLLKVAMRCASDLPQSRPSMTEVRRTIEEWESWPLPDQIIEENDDLSERTSNLPNGGVMEVSDRVYGSVRNENFEARELQVEDQAVYSEPPSQDANTSNRENEVQEWPIQSNTASWTSVLLPTLHSQLEASAHSAPDGSLASSDSAFSSLDPQSDQQFLSGPPAPPTSTVSRTPSLVPVLTHPPTPTPPPHVPLLLDTTMLNERDMLKLTNDTTRFRASGAPVERVMRSLKLFQNGSLTEKSIEPPEQQSVKQQPVISIEPSHDGFSGDNVHFHKLKERIPAMTATNLEITSGGDSASSSAVSSDSIEAAKELVHNIAQIAEIKMLQEEKPCQPGGVTSSTSMSPGYDYDIFLSFRGPDTRSGIMDFLYTSLLAAGIRTYRDDEELPIGEEIGPELLKAINHSKISIPIFSQHYAFSKWCLSELAQMVECMNSGRQKIMPIFYDVTPSEVRHQTGSYGDAFISHEKQFEGNVISKWKAALKEVGNLKGWDINSMTTRREGELVKLVVQKVTAELKRPYLPVTDCLVGIEHHVKEINRMVCGSSEDIQIVGIHGMGGVGKTTLAKIIYNQLSNHFENCCFLSNVQDTSQLKGIECLQNQLISDILKRKLNISNVEEGIKIIKERLYGKKVLVLFHYKKTWF